MTSQAFLKPAIALAIPLREKKQGQGGEVEEGIGGEKWRMIRVVAFIANYPVVDRIIDHWKLTFIAINAAACVGFPFLEIGIPLRYNRIEIGNAA